MLCLWPFKHLSIDNRGNFRPCCSWRHIDYKKFYPDAPVVNFNQSSVKEYFDSLYLKNIMQSMENDRFPNGGCMDCQKDIEIGNQELSLLNDGFMKYPNNKQIKLVDMEIKFGNLCNLGCVMCSAVASSLIESENLKYHALFEEHGIPFHSEKILNPGIQWYEKDEKLKELAEYASKCQHIRFTGGEPTINSYLQKFLEYLAEMNTDIDLKITTNGHKISSKLIQILEQFSRVHFDFSIDGYSKVNEFIRWPSNFDNICNNIDQCSKMMNSRITVKTTLHAMNVHDMPNVCRWVEQNDNINDWDINLVWDPEFLQPCLASDESKQKFIEYANQHNHHKCSNIKYGLNALENKLSAEKTSQHKILLDKYLVLLSKIRKLDWKEYIQI